MKNKSKTSRKKTTCQFCKKKFTNVAYADHLKNEHTTKLRGLCSNCYTSNVELASDVLKFGRILCVKCAIEQLTESDRKRLSSKQKMKTLSKI